MLVKRGEGWAWIPSFGALIWHAFFPSGDFSNVKAHELPFLDWFSFHKPLGFYATYSHNNTFSLLEFAKA